MREHEDRLGTGGLIRVPGKLGRCYSGRSIRLDSPCGDDVAQDGGVRQLCSGTDDTNPPHTRHPMTDASPPRAEVDTPIAPNKAQRTPDAFPLPPPRRHLANRGQRLAHSCSHKLARMYTEATQVAPVVSRPNALGSPGPICRPASGPTLSRSLRRVPAASPRPRHLLRGTPRPSPQQR